MILRNYWNQVCIMISLAMAAIILASIYPLVMLDDDATTRMLSFMTCHLAGMVICFILFISVFADRRVSEATYYFMCLISFEFLSLFLEFIFWHTKSYLYDDILLQAIYYSECLMFPSILYLFANYERCILKLDKDTFRRYGLPIWVLFGTNIAFLIINMFNGWFFTVEDGAYVNGPMYLLQFIPPLGMLLLCAWIAYRYSVNRRHKYILILYVTIPLTTVIAKLPEYSSSLTYLATLVSFIFMYGEIYLNRGIQIVKNEAVMTERKVAMIMSRIEPEFLEEALITIADMEGNPPETKKAIEDFVKYLGENVDTISEKRPISLEQELGHVKTYVNLEKLRFKEKLNVVFDIRDIDFKIPPMTLQMIVENAIKHGITQREKGGTVTVITEELPDVHRITVIDDGVGFDKNAPRSTNRSHIGLDSVSERLREMLGGTFEITSVLGEGTTAVITIPKEI